MSSKIGFLLATHANPDQILFLCRRLGTMFGSPPIAIHHDFSQTPLDRSTFPQNVRFVENYSKTSWGGIGVVTGELSALELLYSFADPDWVTLLSSADYPIQTADRILADLASSEYDGFLDSREIFDYGGRFRNEALGEFPFEQPRFHQFAFNRYVAINLLTPQQARKLKTSVEAWTLRSPWLIRRNTPFGSEIKPFAGDAWFTVNRRVAQFLLQPSALKDTLLRHFQTRIVPEEAFYHTLLGNSPGFKIAPRNLRYTDWKGCYAHPRTLGREDFPRLLASADHFARKFPWDPALLSELDRAVETKAAVGA